MTAPTVTPGLVMYVTCDASADAPALTTVDREHGTGDEARLVRRQEQRGMGDIPGAALAPPERDEPIPTRAHLVPVDPKASAMPSTAIGVSIRPA